MRRFTDFLTEYSGSRSNYDAPAKAVREIKQQILKMAKVSKVDFDNKAEAEIALKKLKAAIKKYAKDNNLEKAKGSIGKNQDRYSIAGNVASISGYISTTQSFSGEHGFRVNV